jgi:F-type H+-transporting ATPase subunit gamma
MATIKQIRRRIRSVQSTRQITKAMEMVAAAKLRKAQGRALAAEPYARATAEALGRLAAAARTLDHPFFEEREARRTLLFVVGSDRGLCGGFNTTLTRRAEALIAERGAAAVRLQPAGERIARYFRYHGLDFPDAHTGVGDQVELATVRRIARLAIDQFVQGEVDRVEFLYTRYVSTAKRVVTLAPVLPVPVAAAAQGGREQPYLFEPDAKSVLVELLPRYVTTRILALLASSFAAEHSARMLAMGNATRNADDVTTALTLTANKLRQGAITKELLEIVGGAEGLA